LSDAAIPVNVTLSSSEQWLAKLGIRPEDKTVTMLLFSNMFLSGIAIGMIRVCALTLFLKHFGSEQLALIAILMALVGMPATILIDRFTYRLSTNTHIMIILGIVMVGLIAFRGMLGITDSSILIFSLPLFFELVYMLFSLQFITLLTRLLNVRQAKRLAGITRSGEFVAETIGGFLIVLLLNYLAVQDLLVVAMLTTGLVFVVVRYTTTHFKTNLMVTNQEVVEGEIADLRMFGMFKITYVKLIAAAYAIYMFAYYFLEVAFYGYASVQYPGDQQLASFIAQFFAATGFLTMFTMVFLFAPFLRKFGIIAGVIAFPIIIFIGSTAISVMEFSGAGIAAIFSVVVVANCARFILQAAIWKPSVAILFQVMPDRQRTTGTSLIEGVVDPVSGGLAGVCLFLLINLLGWEPKHFMILLSLLMLIWLVIGLYIRQMYLSSLVVSIQKRKLGEMSISELDNASLDIIKAGLASPYPSEIFYCLNLLEEIEHPEITELLKTVLAHENRDVRMDALKRVAALQIPPLTSHVMSRIEVETDTAVQGQAIITFASLSPENTINVLLPYLENDSLDLRRGALIGILCHDPVNDNANNYLLRLIRSENKEDRLFASEIIGEIGSDHFSGFLIELITDPDINVVERAVHAAGLIQDNRLINPLVLKLAEPTLLPTASTALRQFGEAALYDLDLGLISPETNRPEKLHIIDIIREIGGVKATEVLLRHIDVKQPEVRHRIFLSLAGLHYQADPDDQYIFVNKLDEEVNNITWLLAAMEDLYGNNKYHLVHSALGHELDVKRDSMLLLVSFLFPSIVMLDTRANIDSKVAELRIFALEILDNLLTGEIKQVVLPLLDDLTVGERLEFLAEKFPQQIMTPDERFSNIVESHFDDAFFWTRNTLLYQIGKDKNELPIDKVRGSLRDKEATIRETALWALTELNPPDLWQTLRAHSVDESPIVNNVVRWLLAKTPEPEEI
jgi:HEAT repeat protein